MTTLELPARVHAAGSSAPTPADFPIAPASADIPATFKAVLLYEDVPTARRASIAAVKLAEGLSPGTRVSQSAWRFDLFDHPQWQFKAMVEAAEADAVIVSSHSTTLPAGVSAWLDAALADHVGLIVILLSGTEEDWTITIRHAAGFSPAPFGALGEMEKTFRCGSRPASLRQSA